MEAEPFTSRLAGRNWRSVALVGATAAVLAAADLLGWTPDWLTSYAAAVVGIAAAIMFLCAVFDTRLRRAVSAMNADRRAEARQRGWISELTGFGLPVGNPALLAVGLLLLVVTLVAANVVHRAPPTALGFAGFCLVTVTQIAIRAGAHSADRPAPPFG